MSAVVKQDKIIPGIEPQQLPPIAQIAKIKNRTLTKRAVIWLGQVCNLRCYFCYFLPRVMDTNHPEHAFMTIEKLKDMCYQLRYFYGLRAIDIQGGEPTIHPDIYELVRYCREIGLIPSLITNAQVLGNPGVAKKFKEAGIYDFAVSLHGIGEAHDDAVCKKGAYDKAIKALEALLEAEITFRFNCTMSKRVHHTAVDIARIALKYGAKAVNLKNFNAFDDQSIMDRTLEDAVSFSQMMPYLTEATDMLEESGVEVNLRYIPYCLTAPRHWKNIYNFQQLSYDHHEWDFESWMWTGQVFQRMKDGPLTPPMRMGRGSWRILYKYERDRRPDDPVFNTLVRAHRYVAATHQLIKGREAIYRREAKVRAQCVLGYQKDAACARCAMNEICDGFQKGYAKLFGTGEAKPIEDHPKVDDPKHFIQEQGKYLDINDFANIEKKVNEAYFGAK